MTFDFMFKLTMSAVVFECLLAIFSIINLIPVIVFFVSALVTGTIVTAYAIYDLNKAYKKAGKSDE